MNVENSIERCKEYMDKFVKRGYVIDFKSFGGVSDAPDGTISVKHLAKAGVALKKARSYDIGDLLAGDGPAPLKALAKLVYGYHILNRNLHPEEYAPKDKPADNQTDKQTA